VIGLSGTRLGEYAGQGNHRDERLENALEGPGTWGVNWAEFRLNGLVGAVV